jgi:hypothetical protein
MPSKCHALYAIPYCNALFAIHLPLTLSATTMPPRKTAVKDSKKLPDLKWIERMEYWLFESLLGQDRLGKRADQGFKSEAWLPVIEAVQEAYDLSGHGPVREITKTQCQGKEAAFKSLYKEHC